MMHKKVALTFAVALAAMLTGCGISSSLNPPAPESAAIPPQDYLGEWAFSDGSGSCGIALAAPDKKAHHVTLRLRETPKNQQAGHIPESLQLGGYFFKVNDRTFLALHVDAERLVKDAKGCGFAVLMLSPRYYLFQVVRENSDDAALYSVSFSDRDGKVVPGNLRYIDVVRGDFGDGKYSELLVLNTTDEIYSFLNGGKYCLPDKEKPLRLTRKP